ncbi:MAG TPA: hypothetical protein VK704_00435 [Acidimicrobiales bacterium]|nr:hypothetical protein [Acidimicrobiales bacterium]
MTPIAARGTTTKASWQNGTPALLGKDELPMLTIGGSGSGSFLGAGRPSMRGS